MADTQRTLGAIGTVEHDYKPKGGGRYSRSERPPRMGASAVTMRDAAPSESAKRGKAKHARQNPEPKPKRVSGGGRALWAQYLGNSREGKYGIRVKVRGCEASDYWVPYSEASKLWHEITGLDFAEVVQDGY